MCGCALLAAACSYSPAEQQVLSTFFRAARLHDTTTLAGVSTIDFDPRTDGSIQEFTIDQIGESQRRAGADGDIITESVTITAKVVSPAGQTRSQTMVLTLQRRIEERWMIVEIHTQGSPAPAG